MIALLLESAFRSLALAAAAWLVLKATGIRGAHLQITAWTVVLCSALAMPLLMQWAAAAVPLPVLRIAELPVAKIAVRSPQVEAAKAMTGWTSALAPGYLLIAGFLLARMLVGLLLTWRMAREAEPVRDGWTEGCDVRASTSIHVPVTCGSKILLPVEWVQWDTMKRAAVIAHERSHVERGDFYVQMLAALHRVVFWFSPLAWWLPGKLSDLAEAVSDDAAIRNVSDRVFYAGILLELARRQPATAGVPMARAATVSKRVERILAGTALIARTGWRRRFALAGCMLPLVVLAASGSMKVQAQTPTHSAGWPWYRMERLWMLFQTGPEPFAVVKDNGVVVNFLDGDVRRPLQYRGRTQGDYIWFERNGSEFLITDPATVQKAKSLFAVQDFISRQQQELSWEQAKVAEQQARLGEQQGRATVSFPDLPTKMEELRQQVDAFRDKVRSFSNKDVRTDELGDLQARIGDLQARIVILQAKAGEKQAILGEEQAKLGQQQAMFGAQQAQLGEKQFRAGEEASRKMQEILSQAQRSGLAKPAH